MLNELANLATMSEFGIMFQTTTSTAKFLAVRHVPVSSPIVNPGIVVVLEVQIELS